MQTLWAGLRGGVRILSRSPAFALTAILILGLGIGVNALVFSVADAILLRPLPYPKADELVWISQGVSSGKTEYALAPNFAVWRSEARSFSQAAAFSEGFRGFVGKGEPERVLAAEASAEFLSMLGVRPAFGRDFLADEGRPGGDRVALLSYDFCARRFTAAGDCVGETIKLEGEPFAVVGVLPEDFRFPQPLDVEVITPLTLDDEQSRRGANAAAGVRQLKVIARLRAGVTLSQAQAELDTLQRGIAEAFPQFKDGRRASLRPLREHLTEGISAAALLLSATVAFLWVLGCLNVGSLMFARTLSRRSEMAVRMSVGASRARLFGQVLAENAVLTFLGCVVSLFIIFWGQSFIVSTFPQRVFGTADIEFNARVVALVVVGFVSTALLVSLISACALPPHNLADFLKSGGASVIGSFKLQRVMNVVVVCELALAVVLLVCAGLMVRSFRALRYRDLGFRPQQILTLRLDLAPSKYPGKVQQAAFFEGLTQRVAALPGVDAVGLCTSAPPTPVGGMFRLTVQGQPAKLAAPVMARVQVVNSDYFRVLRIPLIEGRAFSDREQLNGAPAVVINRTLKQEYLPDGEAVGMKIRLGGPHSPWVTVVGVAEDFKNVGLASDPEAEVYYPYQHFPLIESMYLLVKSSAVDPSSLAPPLRREVRALDREQPLAEVQTLDQRLTASVAHPRFVMSMLAGFAVLALVLAAAGVYGVMSYAGRQRTREIAVRMALGAQRKQILLMMLKESLLLSLLGAAIGMVGARTAGHLLSSMLYGVAPSDAYTFVTVLALLIFTAVFSCYLTARRAVKVEPVEILRHQ